MDWAGGNDEGDPRLPSAKQLIRALNRFLEPISGTCPHLISSHQCIPFHPISPSQRRNVQFPHLAALLRPCHAGPPVCASLCQFRLKPFPEAQMGPNAEESTPRVSPSIPFTRRARSWPTTQVSPCTCHYAIFRHTASRPGHLVHLGQSLRDAMCSASHRTPQWA